jgi:hypothetical protein
MKTVMLEDVSVVESYPDSPVAGDRVWRLVKHRDAGVPLFELHAAEYVVEDGGDYLTLGMFEQVSGGVGIAGSIEEEIDKFNQYEEVEL